jgi:hypothetical protein
MATDQELLQRLFTEEDRVSRETVDEILRRGATLGPELLRILRDEAAWDAEFPAGWAVVHAAYLLAALRPPGSLDALVAAVDRAADYDDDWLSEPAPFLLAAYGPDALPVLRTAAFDRRRDPYARVWMFEALSLIADRHPETRETVMAALREVVDDRRCDQDVRACAAFELLDFTRPEDRKRIEAAADGDILTRDMIEAAYTDGVEARPAYDWMTFYDPDQIAERQREPAEPQDVDPIDGDPEAPAEDAPPEPIKAAPAIGRNAPCPCGSHKKYKKCCGK